MLKLTSYSLFIALVCVLFSCEEGSMKKESGTPSDSIAIEESVNYTTSGDTLMSGSLKLYPLTDSPLFQDAIINLNTPSEGAVIKNNLVEFNYEIKNYELTKPTTTGCCATSCANSSKGQHIHLILNNEPYLAKYSTSFSDSLKDGHYVALSFLSRSYHESIKHYDTYDLRQFTVGAGEEKKVDLTKPLLFYSRPKGEYKGAETQKVLLDFYAVNAHLAPSEYKVRATINGVAFMITTWKAYLMEGLPLGENKVKIELLDKDGNLVNSEFNSTERTFTLSE